MNMQGIAFCCRALMPYIDSPFQFCSSVAYPDKRLVDPCLSAVDLASNSTVATGRKASECSVPEVLLHYGMSAVGPDCLAGSRGGFGEGVAPSP